MSLSASFIPIQEIAPIPAFKVLPGQIAFISGHRFPMLRAETSNSKAMFLDLGGGSFLTAREAGHMEETCFVLSNWKLEIDPNSLSEGRHNSYVSGYAYSMKGSCGIYAVRANSHAQNKAIAISTDGHESPVDHESPRLFFSKWRIVSGSADAFIILAESAKVES